MDSEVRESGGYTPAETQKLVFGEGKILSGFFRQDRKSISAAMTGKGQPPNLLGIDLSTDRASAFSCLQHF